MHLLFFYNKICLADDTVRLCEGCFNNLLMGIPQACIVPSSTAGICPKLAWQSYNAAEPQALSIAEGAQGKVGLPQCPHSQARQGHGPAQGSGPCCSSPGNAEMLLGRHTVCHEQLWVKQGSKAEARPCASQTSQRPEQRPLTRRAGLDPPDMLQAHCITLASHSVMDFHTLGTKAELLQ